jgi:hypothetical protein
MSSGDSGPYGATREFEERGRYSSGSEGVSSASEVYVLYIGVGELAVGQV